MNKKQGNQNLNRSLDVHKLISKIRDDSKRNLLRGLLSKKKLYGEDLERIRENNSTSDNVIIGALLKSEKGLRQENKKNNKRQSSDIFMLTSFPPLDWKGEVAYTAGYINSVPDHVFDILDRMRDLVWIENISAEEALKSLLEISEKYGASNYISYKLAYTRTAKDLSASALASIAQIEIEMGHSKMANMHFSALENVSSKVSLFGVAQRRVSGMVGKVDGKFRRSLALSNFIPTPLDEEDVAGFLLRSSESSLIDAIYSIIILFNLNKKFDAVVKEFENVLSKPIVKKISDFLLFANQETKSELITDQYFSNNTKADFSLSQYRISAAFLERKCLAIYRNEIDCVIGVRLLAEIIGEKASEYGAVFEDKSILLGNEVCIFEDSDTVPLDTFYRTFLFLRFIQDKMNLSVLETEEVKFIFENTMRLESLLTEDEISTIHVTSSEANKDLVSILALALYRSKSIDPDVDYEFRADFIEYVNRKHASSILDFINSLLADSPDVAHYIVASLDEVTLEKMYTLVKNSSEASEIRGSILRAIGEKLNRIEFIIEADAITTRAKLSTLQRYFDSSRMYVDSVAMKKWLDSNPNISTEQYRSLYPKVQALVADSGDKSLIFFKIADQTEHLISQIVKEAFEQFCSNTEFGIQSYLGRRIRHNTLDGVTTDTVDAVFRKPEYSVVTKNSSIKKTIDAWLISYKNIIDKLRKDQLQFSQGGSLFNANLDLDDQFTKDNIRKLVDALKTAGGGELLNDLVIAFCWKQITPQLENAARYIRTNLLKEAKSSIDKSFSGYFGVVESQIKQDLHDAVNEVLKKVADWFQVPQTGFITACVQELCQIILIEISRNNHVKFLGNALNQKFTGISVHRLYDCVGVLIKNAQKHAEPDSDLIIEANAVSQNSESPLVLLNVKITSKVKSSDFQRSKIRILNAIDSVESGTDMVTEGYTGIKKIKVITRASERHHTVTSSFNEQEKAITLGFSIHVEVSTEPLGEELT